MAVTSSGTGFDLPALWDVMNACSGRVVRHTSHVLTRRRSGVCWLNRSINNRKRRAAWPPLHREGGWLGPAAEAQQETPRVTSMTTDTQNKISAKSVFWFSFLEKDFQLSWRRLMNLNKHPRHHL